MNPTTTATEMLYSRDPEREACLACVTVHRPAGSESVDKAEETGEIAEPPPDFLEACRVSENEVFYDEIRQIYQAGLHSTMCENGEPGDFRVVEKEPEGRRPVPDVEKGDAKLDYAPSVLRRRSKRNYVPTPFPGNSFMRLLNLVIGVAGQVGSSAHPVAPFLSIGFLADDVEGLEPGFYLLDPVEGTFTLATSGRLTHPMSDACLNQRWLKNSAVHFVFMADLPALDKALGPRGYRYAMIQAGALGQSIYLGATALGIGLLRHRRVLRQRGGDDPGVERKQRAAVPGGGRANKIGSGNFQFNSWNIGIVCWTAGFASWLYDS